MANITLVTFTSLVASVLCVAVSSNNDNGCLAPFCHCVKRKNSEAICSGRSLNYIPRFPKYVTSVIITNTSLRHIGQFGLFNLTFYRIESITLTDNLLESIGRNAFQNLTSLSEIVISREQRLDVNMLKGSLHSLPANLRILSFPYNSWRMLPADMFAGLGVSSIRHLFLEGNNLAYINFTIFQNITGIEWLDLSDNLIERVTLIKLETLLVLNLDGNKISKIPNWCGKKMEVNFFRLRILSMSHNSIGNINNDSFKCLPNLRKLQLEATNIGKIQNNVFSGLPKFTELRLKKTCNPLDPLYNIAIVLGVFVFMVLAVGVPIVKCQANIKNYIYLLRVNRYKQMGYVSLSNEEDFEYHAFVVYCDKDRAWVHGEFLRKIEQEEGLRLCIHHRNFEVGEDITSNVDNFMQKSWKVVVVISNNFAESQWCQWEMDIVHERRRQYGPIAVVPILLQNIDSNHMISRIRTLLESTPHLRYRSGVGSDLFWRTVIESLRKSLDHPPVSLT